MEKGRVVNTKFWRDSYIVKLNPVEKLVFLYLLTNAATNLSGVYELDPRMVALETGIDTESVSKCMERFTKDGKIHYVDGWLVLKNFMKHQRMNPSMLKNAAKHAAVAPKWAQALLPTDVMKAVSQQSGDSLSTDYRQIKENKIKRNKIKRNINNTTDVVLGDSSPLRFGTHEINDLFDYWHQKIGYPIKTGNKKNRYAASNLLKAYGTDKVKQLIDGVALAHQDRYAPGIADFASLQSKLNELLAWGKKKGITNGKRAIDLT